MNLNELEFWEFGHMKALFMRMTCIWRKYPGSIVMGESGGIRERLLRDFWRWDMGR